MAKKMQIYRTKELMLLAEGLLLGGGTVLEKVGTLEETPTASYYRVTGTPFVLVVVDELVVFEKEVTVPTSTLEVLDSSGNPARPN